MCGFIEHIRYRIKKSKKVDTTGLMSFFFPTIKSQCDKGTSVYYKLTLISDSADMRLNGLVRVGFHCSDSQPCLTIS